MEVKVLLEAGTGRKPGITLTPLIDVVFILLVFFMLVMQFQQVQQMPVALSDDIHSSQSENEVYIIKLLGEGNCQVNAQVTICNDVIELLPEKINTTVHIAFSQNIQLGNIIAMQDKLNLAGIDSLISITQKP